MGDHAYIGRKSCGCVMAVTVDDADDWTAENVAEFIRDGLTIERVTGDYVRSLDHLGCKCEKQPAPSPVLQAALL